MVEFFLDVLCFFSIVFELVFFFLFFFFFFQAEDGIRDLTVTGVQTCALPISSAIRTATPGCCRRSPRDSRDASMRPTRRSARRPSSSKRCDALKRRTARSEERRVGKECRSRGAPDQ